MNPKEQHDAFKFLHSEIHPDEKRIDGLSHQELDEHLETHGVDLKTLNAHIASKKESFQKKLDQKPTTRHSSG